MTLAFIAPVHFLSFPAILKGWLDRVWTPGFAYDLTPEAWRGDIDGRRPKLTHAKALIIQSTIHMLAFTIAVRSSRNVR